MLYLLLRSEDFALLLGSLLIFGLLTVVMVLTRKLDWYELGSDNSADYVKVAQGSEA